MGGVIPSMAILNFLLIATGTISQICAALPSTWQLPTAASPAPPLLWKFKTGQSIENAVAVGNGIVYAGSDDDSVYALNATTGEKIWQDDEYSTTSQSMMTPTVADGIVYFSVTGTLYAADSMNGTVLWKYRVNQVWHNQTINDYSSTTSPAIKDNIVYVGSGSYLSALHAKTGELKWIIQVGPHVFQDTIASAPTVAEGIVHFAANEACTPKPPGSFPSDDACIYAADAKTGAIRWSFAVLESYRIRAGASVDKGIVYFGSTENHLYAVNANSGALQWSFSTEDDCEFTPACFVDSTPSIVDGILYVGTENYYLYAFNLKSGLGGKKLYA